MKRKTEETSPFFEEKKYSSGEDELVKRFKSLRINDLPNQDEQNESNERKQDLIKDYEYFADYFIELNKNPSLRERKEIIKGDLGMLLEKNDFLLDYNPIFYSLIGEVLEEKEQFFLAAEFMKKSIELDKTSNKEMSVVNSKRLVNVLNSKGEALRDRG